MNRMDLEGTSIYPLIQNMENIYRMIAEQQQLWKETFLQMSLARCMHQQQALSVHIKQYGPLQKMQYKMA